MHRDQYRQPEFIGLQNSWDRDGIRAEFERLDTRRYGRFK